MNLPFDDEYENEWLIYFNLPIDDELDKCIICIEKIKNKRVLFCNHKFCYNCIDNWLKKNDTCPTCREIVVIRTVITFQKMKNSFKYVTGDVDSLCILCGDWCTKKAHCSNRFNGIQGILIGEKEYPPTVIYFCDNCEEREEVYEYKKYIYFLDGKQFIYDICSIRMND
jgi:hypothetical protein